MGLPHLTEAAIHRHASADSIRRGREYYRQGSVLSLVRRGDTLEARVQGSEPEPYRVRCAFDDTRVTKASCTCLYPYGDWCKHVVATLLAVAGGEEVEERPPREAMLDELDRERLQRLLLRLAEG